MARAASRKLCFIHARLPSHALLAGFCFFCFDRVRLKRAGGPTWDEGRASSNPTSRPVSRAQGLCVIKGKEAEDEESLRVRLLAAEEEQVILEEDEDRDDEEDKDDRGEEAVQICRPAGVAHVGIA